MPKKMSSVSSFGSMVKDWVELALLQHPVLACGERVHVQQWPGHRGSRDGLVLDCPQIMVYLLGFPKGQDVSSAQN